MFPRILYIVFPSFRKLVFSYSTNSISGGGRRFTNSLSGGRSNFSSHTGEKKELAIIEDLIKVLEKKLEDLDGEISLREDERKSLQEFLKKLRRRDP